MESSVAFIVGLVTGALMCWFWVASMREQMNYWEKQAKFWREAHDSAARKRSYGHYD